MSTDDLTRRAREAIAGYALYGTPALVSELADEVDRLRGERHECAMQWRDAHDMFGAVRDERDAARAALGRVTDLLTLWARLASQQANLGDVVHDLTRALEGES